MSDHEKLIKSIYSSQKEVLDSNEIEEEVKEISKVNTLDEATRFTYGLLETRKSIKELREIAWKEIDKWKEKIAEVQEWLKLVLTPQKAKEEFLNDGRTLNKETGEFLDFLKVVPQERKFEVE